LIRSYVLFIEERAKTHFFVRGNPNRLVWYVRVTELTWDFDLRAKWKAMQSAGIPARYHCMGTKQRLPLQWRAKQIDLEYRSWYFGNLILLDKEPSIVLE